MIRRVLISALLAIYILLLLLWPISQIGFSLSIKRGAGVSVLALQDGAIRALITPRTPGTALERDQYTFAWTHTLQPMPNGKLYQFTKNTAGAWDVGLSLLWPTLASIPVLGLILWLSRRRKRKQLASHICLACGFQRGSAEGPCNECGLHQADLARRSLLAPLIRDALILVLICLGLLTWSMYFLWRADERLAAQFKARVFDYSWYLENTSPQLSGEVFYAEPGSGPHCLTAMLRRAGPGSTIVLLPGDHALNDPRQRSGTVNRLSDIWLLGSSPSECTLSIELEQARRVRFESLTINCHDDPFIDSRGNDMAVHLRDCHIINYNSGAGGSNSIYSSGAVLLIDYCEFNGKEGRASSSMRGDALDLRGTCRVYARNTNFIDNDEIGRNPDMVLDNCQFHSDKNCWPPSSNVLARNFNTQRFVTPFQGRPFTQAVDDYGPLETFAGTRSLDAWTDLAARDLIEQAGIPNDPGFWRRLLLHPEPKVRALAQKQLPLPDSPPEPTSLEASLQHLDKLPLSRPIVESLLSDPSKSRPLLLQKAQTGSEVEQRNAKALLRLMDVQPPLSDILAAQHLTTK